MIGVLARRMEELKASEIRELLKVTEQEEMISLAGGLPAPETFPVPELAAAVSRLLAEHGPAAMQYSTTEGYQPLRAKIAARMNASMKTTFSADDLLITNGSQQGLDLTGKIFLDEGDEVLCESPTYLGAVNALRAYSPRFVEVATDDDGMIAEDLEAKLVGCRRPKLIYVVPDFQNPTGRSWSLERRQALLEIAARWRVPVIEDAPYREVRFAGEPVPTLAALDRYGIVVHLGTFSKIFAPGMRLGWLATTSGLREKYVLVKQGADLHTSTFTQMAVDTYLESNDIDAAIVRIRRLYRSRRDAMVAALEREMPEGATFTRPEGGLFCWLQLPGDVDAREVLAAALKRGVAAVPGGSFFPNGGHENTMRLNFSNMSEERIAEGIRRLGVVIAEFRAVHEAACEQLCG